MRDKETGKLKGKGGVIWAVRYATDDGRTRAGAIRNILADEIDAALDHFDETGKDWTSDDLAMYLIDGMHMKPSGVGPVAENNVIREGVQVGVPMIDRLTKMAEKATLNISKLKAAGYDGSDPKVAEWTGRRWAMCQALAFVKSPTTWEKSTAEGRKNMIQAELQRVARAR